MCEEATLPSWIQITANNLNTFFASRLGALFGMCVRSVFVSGVYRRGLARRFWFRTIRGHMKACCKGASVLGSCRCCRRRFRPLIAACLLDFLMLHSMILNLLRCLLSWLRFGMGVWRQRIAICVYDTSARGCAQVRSSVPR